MLFNCVGAETEVARLRSKNGQLHGCRSTQRLTTASATRLRRDYDELYVGQYDAVQRRAVVTCSLVR